MPDLIPGGKETRYRSRWATALPTILAVSLVAGCADFWEEATRKDFKFDRLFVTPDPLEVLQNSTDGDDRARAFLALGERDHGSDKQSETVLKILVTAASGEKQVLCRLAAIDSLGHFDDPRAVTGLQDAFYASGSFTAEQAVRIKCEVLRSLGQTHHASAVKFLTDVVKAPPGEGSEQEKQMVMDERIAAARALGSFKDGRATDALVAVLKKERDIALRDCAAESLQASTGQKLPPELQAGNDAIFLASYHENKPAAGAPAPPGSPPTDATANHP